MCNHLQSCDLKSDTGRGGKIDHSRRSTNYDCDGPASGIESPTDSLELLSLLKIPVLMHSYRLRAVINGVQRGAHGLPVYLFAEGHLLNSDGWRVSGDDKADWRRRGLQNVPRVLPSKQDILQISIFLAYEPHS